MRYAIVENNIVTNIIALNPAGEKYFPSAVCIDNRPVFIGDFYDEENQNFMRDGEKVLTPEEEIFEYQEAFAYIFGERVLMEE